MACRPTHCLLILHVIFTCLVASHGSVEDEANTLIKLRDSLSNHTALSNWNTSVALCRGNHSDWTGLLCQNNTFYGLQLEGMGLTGVIDVDILADLPDLRTISFMNNSFGGQMPNVSKISALRGVYLSNNGFSGDIPDDIFDGMSSLKKVYLAYNQFSGKIPKSLADRPLLVELKLEDNQFDGRIPDFQSKDLEVVDMENNNFEGPIPASLSGINSTAFEGNKNLCGKPLAPCKVSKTKHKYFKIALIAVAAAVVAMLLICIAAFIIRGRRGTKASKLGKSSSKKTQNKAQAHKAAIKENPLVVEQENNFKIKNQEQGKLYFVRNDRERFELQDLLRASADVLGSGSFGSSYKAVLLSGPAMVVKRFRQMSNVGREEFHEHMKRLGRLSHPNLLPLVAFYYKKEEKLLISDFVENGSLASHLHGNHSPKTPNHSGLDWPTRLKIIKGVAKGLAYLYKEFPSMNLPHGHLKSSNVLLDGTFEPLLTDYALTPVINKDHAQQSMVAYKSPEYTQHDRTTKKSDVWSLGILILEMLTGKFPANYLKQGKGANADLSTWVNSVVREEWTGEVFDKDMKATRNGEGELLKLLKIGICCCECNVERRWDWREAVDKIEELKERDSDEDNSSYASEGDVYSSRAMTEDEDFSFSVAG